MSGTWSVTGKWLARSATAGGMAVGGLVVFPHFEDWYWVNERNSRKSLHQEQDRKRLVILGSGWASVSVLKHIDRDKYDVTVVSPRNFFLYTPLLPSVATGTITQEAVTVPIRDITSYKILPIWKRMWFIWRGYLPPKCNYLYASATKIDPNTNLVTCKHRSSDFDKEFTIAYDQLVVATGATNNTFNTKGVEEYGHFLKQTGDAAIVRQTVIENLEKASLPGVSEEDKKKLLSFLIVGGGPTGVEFAVELQDFLTQDAVNTKTQARANYPNCLNHTSVSIIQSNDHLLPGWPRQLQKFAEQHIVDSGIRLLTGTRVLEVDKDIIKVLDKKTKSKREIPFGLVVWATGVSPGKLVTQLMSQLPEQTNYRSLHSDSQCRVLGTENIWAIGDCADIDVLPEYKAFVQNLYDKVMTENMGSGDHKYLNEEANARFVRELREHLTSGELGFPEAHGINIQNKIIDEFSSRLSVGQKAGTTDGAFRGITKEDATAVVTEQIKRQKHLPPLAQVAHQQGEYLAGLLNEPKIDEKGEWSFDHGPSFQYRNLGKLIYVGSEMAAIAVPASDKVELTWGGSFVNLIWHAAYFGMLESPSARSELLFEWIRGWIFGRSTVLNAVATNTSDSEMESLALPRLPVVDDYKSGSGVNASNKAKAAKMWPW